MVQVRVAMATTLRMDFLVHRVAVQVKDRNMLHMLAHCHMWWVYSAWVLHTDLHTGRPWLKCWGTTYRCS